MRLLDGMHAWIRGRLLGIASRRPPDFFVGGAENPYLRRWYLIPRNRWCNVYLHEFLRNDDDRALHDHYYPWCSILLKGGYTEHTIAAGGVHQRQLRQAPSIKISGPWRAHRIELLPAWFAEDDFDTACDIHSDNPDAKAPCWTLFITGPRIRNWGFHCPNGWVPWQRFTDPSDPGKTGSGCGEVDASVTQRALALDHAREQAAERRRLEAEVETPCRSLASGDVWNDYSSDLATKMHHLVRLGRMQITARSAGGAVCARWINPDLPPSMVAANDNTPAASGNSERAP